MQSALIDFNHIMDLGIHGKRALVLAASDGLGKAVAAELVAAGVRVVISSRNSEKLAATAAAIGAEGTVQADLGVTGEAARIVEETVAQLGGIDILVTNAGGPPAGKFKDLDDAQWCQSFQELFIAVTESVRASLPHMAAGKWGRVVMITSIAGKEPIANLTLSNALRPAVHGLMNTLAKEHGPDGVTFNAILPSFTNTARVEHLTGGDTSKLAANIPVGRIGEPEEFGKLAAFLCSAHAGYISGQAIGFDGGSMQSW